MSAGVTLYVAASDLVPEVNEERSIKMALVVFLGVFALDPAGTVLITGGTNNTYYCARGWGCHGSSTVLSSAELYK